MRKYHTKVSAKLLVMQPCFKSKTEKSKKGKGSYSRKHKGRSNRPSFIGAIYE